MKKFLETKMRVVEHAPESQDAFAKAIFDRCFLRTHDGSEPQGTRREEAVKEFLKFFPCAWTGLPVHVCPPNCCGPGACASRDVSVERAMRLLDRTILQLVQVPAMNKWTKVDPAICQVALMANFCGAVPAAFERKLGGRPACGGGAPRPRGGGAPQGGGGAPRPRGGGAPHGGRGAPGPGGGGAPHGGRGAPDPGGGGAPPGGGGAPGPGGGGAPQGGGGAPPAADDESSDAEGAPAAKACICLSNPGTPAKLLLWLCVSLPAFCVHYRLFNTATFFGHSKRRGCGVFDFLYGSKNPGAEAVTKWSQMLLDAEGVGSSGWRLLVLRQGRPSEWRQELKQEALVCLLTGLALMWRHLVKSWLRYPWRCSTLGDLAASDEQRAQAARKLMASPECCLDVGLSLKLQRGFRSWQECLQPDVRTFLHAVFNRSVVTSTFVERAFSQLTRWSRKRQTLSSLSSRHTVSTFASMVARWEAARASRRRSLLRKVSRTPSGPELPSQSNVLKRKRQSDKFRPHWMKVRARGARRTGLQMFMQSSREAGVGTTGRVPERWAEWTAAWKNLPSEERLRFRQKARESRAAAAVRPAVLDQTPVARADPGVGPWNLASDTGPWPLAADPLREMLAPPGAFKEISSNWRRRNSDIQCRDPSFPQTVAATQPCFEDTCPFNLTEEQRQAADAQLAALSLALDHCPDCAREVPVLEFSCHDLKRFVVVAHRSFARPVEATLCSLLPQPAGHGALALGFEVTAAGPAGELWPVFTTEVAFVHLLVRAQPELWSIVWLETRRGASLTDFEVLSRIEVDLEDLRNREELRKEEDRAFRRALHPRPVRDPGKQLTRELQAALQETQAVAIEKEEYHDYKAADWEAAVHALWEAQAKRLNSSRVQGAAGASSSAGGAHPSLVRAQAVVVRPLLARA